MLVSIIVITYNSEKTILETLESIKAQKYKNLEVIISDDGSRDKTLNICKKWIKENNNFFIRIQIISSEKNEGVIKNVNKGCKESKGEWIKIIAGDDILFENCIVDNLKYVMKNKKINFLFSRVKTIEANERILPKRKKDFFYKYSASKQYNCLLIANFIMAPSSFMNSKKLSSFNYFDEDFNVIEDLSFYLKITSQNEKIYFMDKITVGYRINENSISNKINLNFLKDLEKIEKKFNKKKSILLKYHYFILKMIYKIKNRNIKILLKCTSPLYLGIKFIELING